MKCIVLLEILWWLYKHGDNQCSFDIMHFIVLNDVNTILITTPLALITDYIDPIFALLALYNDLVLQFKPCLLKLLDVWHFSKMEKFTFLVLRTIRMEIVYLSMLLTVGFLIILVIVEKSILYIIFKYNIKEYTNL